MKAVGLGRGHPRSEVPRRAGSRRDGAEVAAARERLLEAVADVDDTLVERYLLGQEIPVGS